MTFMSDTLREYMSYYGLCAKLLRAEKKVTPERVRFGRHKDQYFLYYEPEKPVSDKIIIWAHGGGWNSGNPEMFDFAGQRAAAEGYRFISLGYRLAPAFKYPCQIRDVCAGFNAANEFLKSRGIATSKLILSGSSAGAQLSALLCYSGAVQEKFGADVSGVIGFIGAGGPYCFSGDQTFTVRTLLSVLFRKDYDRRNGEPLALMRKSDIPMLLIQSRHDGVIDFSCAEKFAEKARRLGISCEIYEPRSPHDTHSRYTAGMFLETRDKNGCLDKFFSWIEEL